jgi:hypothetical protein
MSIVRGSESKTGVAPQYRTAFALAMNEIHSVSRESFA